MHNLIFLDTAISRRDRVGVAHGGVILFAKFGYERKLVHLGNFEIADRFWFVIQFVTGPLLFGASYLRSCHGEIASVERL